MARRLLPLLILALLVAGGILLALRPPGGGASVTLFCAVDDEVARALVPRFTEETGIRVDLVTDNEMAKSVGLAKRIREEGAAGRSPTCDVWWNNEPLWTENLAGEGFLEAYDSPAAADVPAEYRDPRRFWTANGLRARLFIVNVKVLGERRPASFRDLADPAWKDLGALARPSAGTTLSHLSALRALLGPEAFSNWFRSLDGNGVTFPSGNGPVSREVGRGARGFGFTDTDDFNVRRAAGEPVAAVFPDQGEGQPGTYVLPVTVALVKGAPHPEAAKRVDEWGVSPPLVGALCAATSGTIPVGAGTLPGGGVPDPRTFRAAKVDWREASKHADPVQDLVKELLK